MDGNPEIVSPSKPHSGGLSRRALLIGAGAATVAAGASIPTIKGIGEFLSSRERQSTLDRFNAAFSPAHQAQRAIHQTYGASLASDFVFPQRNVGNPQIDIWEFLSLANDHPQAIDETSYRRFIEGWAQGDVDQQSLIRKAAAKIQKLTITDDSGNITPIDTTSTIYQGLQRLATIMPTVFLYGIDRIHLMQEGFAAFAPDEKFTGTLFITPRYLAGDKLSPAELAGLIHELSHTEGVFLLSPHATKAYTRLQEYAHFLQAKAEGIKEVADAYFQENNPDPIKFENGEQFIDIASPTTELTTNTHERLILQLTPMQVAQDKAQGKISYSMEDVQRWMQEKYQIFLEDFPLSGYDNLYKQYQGSLAYPEFLGHRLSERVNALVLAIGRKLSARDIDPQLRSALLQDIFVQGFMNKFFGEVEHYFVGPVQSPLPNNSSQNQLANRNNPPPNTHLTRVNMRIQQARLRLIATGLPKNVLDSTDPLICISGLSDALYATPSPFALAA